MNRATLKNKKNHWIG